MWICKAVFALAVVLFTVKAQELEETEGKKFYVKTKKRQKLVFAEIHIFPTTYGMQPLSPTVGAIFKN